MILQSTSQDLVQFEDEERHKCDDGFVWEVRVPWLARVPMQTVCCSSGGSSVKRPH